MLGECPYHDITHILLWIRNQVQEACWHIGQGIHRPQMQEMWTGCFSAQREHKHLDKFLLGPHEEAHPFCTQDGWHWRRLNICLHIEGTMFQSEEDAPILQSHYLFYCHIVDAIRSVCTSKSAESFHLTPYTMHWIPNPNSPDKSKHIYSEAFTSDAMIHAQADIDNLPQLAGDTREHVAFGIMLASDLAQLTNFGTASVWPIYLMFANQPKQERVKPSCHTVHHIVYVPSVSLSTIEWWKHLTGFNPDQQRLCKPVSRGFRSSTLARDCGPLQAGTHAHCVEPPYGPRLPWWMYRRPHHTMLQWQQAGILYLHTHILSWLSWKVSQLSLLFVVPRYLWEQRVLLVTIKNLGQSPCPQCLIKRRKYQAW